MSNSQKGSLVLMALFFVITAVKPMLLSLTVAAVFLANAKRFGSYFIRKDDAAGKDKELLMLYYRSFVAISIIGKKLFTGLAVSFMVFTVIAMFNMGDTTEVYRYVLSGLNLATVIGLSFISARILVNQESTLFKKEVDAEMSAQRDGSGGDDSNS